VCDFNRLCGRRSVTVVLMNVKMSLNTNTCRTMHKRRSSVDKRLKERWEEAVGLFRVQNGMWLVIKRGKCRVSAVRQDGVVYR
jgi:hypothetical protein